MKYTKEYKCPYCDNDVEVDVGNTQAKVSCGECRLALRVEYDADYDDAGKPVDKTKLVGITL